jgi:hypothetical protein
MSWNKLEFRHLKKDYDKRHREQLRLDVIASYGGKCSCCMQSIITFLQVDHVSGGGRIHALMLGGSKSLYKLIKENGYSLDYQILCANCNLGKYRNYGQCPHVGLVIPDNISVHHKLYRDKLRTDVYHKLGSTCICCGETNDLFLTVDHINGGGTRHRKQVGNNEKILIAVRNMDNPSIDYQLLCMNCNIGGLQSTGCPHRDINATRKV